ncbi:LytTR family DNA-binding domain-containing protein [Aliikangiella sp. G2MR2-5]|uniref:LytR/AlgR family response regulator transcription factor n=1 Tax=Aliikangiella sp. G2MR2-5 TaxID=2788943 RepID=UPI0018AADC30|nr:LytTR family DNA-binding domain-containing protein [Aliikangiella sp. G2MR2-5]
MFQTLAHEIQYPGKKFVFSVKSLQALYLFWSSFILIVALNCYSYETLMSDSAHSFQQSLIWAGQYWWSWALLSPLAILDSRKIVARQFAIMHLKNYMLHALLFSLAAILLSTIASVLFSTELSVHTFSKQFFNELYIGLVVYSAVVIAGTLLIMCAGESTSTHSESQQSELEQEKQYAKQLMVIKGNSKVLLDVHDICFISAAGNYLEINANEDNFLIRKTMKAMIQMLDPSLFIRIHRSTIVARNCIQSITPRSCGDHKVQLNCGTHFIISKSYRDVLKSLLVETRNA